MLVGCHRQYLSLPSDLNQILELSIHLIKNNINFSENPFISYRVLTHRQTDTHTQTTRLTQHIQPTRGLSANPRYEPNKEWRFSLGLLGCSHHHKDAWGTLGKLHALLPPHYKWPTPHHGHAASMGKPPVTSAPPRPPTGGCDRELVSMARMWYGRSSDENHFTFCGSLYLVKLKQTRHQEWQASIHVAYPSETMFYTRTPC